MRNFLAMMTKDLHNLFVSPIAYVLIGVFFAFERILFLHDPGQCH